MTNSKRRRKRVKIQRERDIKLHDNLVQYIDFSRVASFDALYKSSYKCQRGVIWKRKVLNFCMRRLICCQRLEQSLLDKTYKPQAPKGFTLHERGKIREIAPVEFVDRVVQRALVDNILEPIMRDMLVKGNAASQVGKGPDWSRDRFKGHLQKAYRNYGKDAYLLQYDFSDYFHSVPTEKVCEMFEKRIRRICLGDLTQDALDILWLTKLFLFQYDGLGIGNQTSQLAAIVYASPIDHAIEELTRTCGYGRYMDDGYAFYPSKEAAKEGLKVLCDTAEKLGLQINRKKTCVRRITGSLGYLKRVYRIDEHGQVNVSISVVSDNMYLRHFSGLCRKVSRGELGYETLDASAVSRRGIAKRVSDPGGYIIDISIKMGEILNVFALDDRCVLLLYA